MDLLIKNSTIFDGKGNPPFTANIGIKKDRIIYIGRDTFSARRIIDAKEYVLAPGFIDTHSHSDFTCLADPRMEGKITQGITTEINGNCGFSAFPMFGDVVERRLPELSSLGLTPWNTLKEFKVLIKKARPAVNFVPLCGHGNIRGSVMGYKKGKANKNDLKKMEELLNKEMLSGVRGLSTGLIYPPGIFADTEEIVELVRVVAIQKGIYTTHIRSEGDRLLAALEETVLIGKKAKIPVHISHLKTSGEENWWKIDTVLKIFEDAHKQGVRITADRYPYVASQTELSAFLPSWIIEGSKEDILKRLKSKTVRAEINDYLKNRGAKFLNSIAISEVASDKDKSIEGRTLGELTDLNRAANFICDILIRSNLYVDVIYFGMSEENLKRILLQPYVMIGTDASARCRDGITARGKPHPRGFGSFPRFIRKYVLDAGLSLQEAIKKITYLPAKIFRIKKRGVIKEGYFADIVIFDPSTIKDKATFKEPFRISNGIKYVIVNGVISVEDNEPTGKRNGRFLL